MTREELELAVEKLVDATSLYRVVEAAARVCFYKASHIEEAWQDRETARAWDNAGKVLDTASSRASVQRVS